MRQRCTNQTVLERSDLNAKLNILGRGGKKNSSHNFNSKDIFVHGLGFISQRKWFHFMMSTLLFSKITNYRLPLQAATVHAPGLVRERGERKKVAFVGYSFMAM